SFFSFLPDKALDVGVREKEIESVDIAPTILDLIDIKLNYKNDGISFSSDLLNDKGKKEKIRFVESGFKSRPDFKKGNPELVNLSRKINFNLNRLTQEWNKDGALFI